MTGHTKIKHDITNAFGSTVPMDKMMNIHFKIYENCKFPKDDDAIILKLTESLQGNTNGQNAYLQDYSTLYTWEVYHF